MTDRDLNQSTPATKNEVIVGDNQILKQETQMSENHNIQVTVIEPVTKEIGGNNSNIEQESQMTTISKIPANYMINKKMVKVVIDDIVIPENSRQEDDEVIDSIAKSIESNGLIYPIIISLDNCLVAGHHRTAAFKKLGITEVEAIKLAFNFKSDECRLISLAENLERKELARLEKAFAIFETVQILSRIRPSIPNSSKISREKAELLADKKIAKQVMEKFKVKKSEYYELFGTAKSIIPELRKYMKDLNVTDDFKVAVDLATLTPGQQQELIANQPTKARFLTSLKEVIDRNTKKIDHKTDQAIGNKEQKKEQLMIEIKEIIDLIGKSGVQIRHEELDKTFEVRLNDNSLLQECDNVNLLLFFLKGMLKLAEIKKSA